MNTGQTNAIIIDGYVGLLDSLSVNDKLDLIVKLTDLVKTDITNKESLFKQAFGAFESEQSAEEMINEIRNSRVSTRHIESL
jgi:hypothetical protein